MNKFWRCHKREKEIKYMMEFFVYVSFAIISCKLSPETSTRGRNADFFFSHSKALIYPVDVDSAFICGDFNSRIADLEITWTLMTVPLELH